MTTPASLCSNCGKRPVLVKKVMLCSGCYYRQKRHGTLEYLRLPQGSTALERFEFYVVRSSEPGGCWIWHGPVNSSEAGRDYGRIWDGNRYALAHRWSYEHFVKPIPDGLEIDHACETPRCVRPDHLEPVTHPVNVKRGKRWPVNPGVPRAERVKPDINRPNCPKCGTPYTTFSNGSRRCGSCFNEYARGWTRRTGRVTGEGKGARQRERTHCPAEHEYTPENTYVDPKGRRDCKKCRKRRNAESRERVRQREQAA
jgi:HNH endonuclease